MELKTYTLPVESSEIWESSEAFKDYVRQFVPNMSTVVQIARPWAGNKARKLKYWALLREVFRKDRNSAEIFCKETLKAGKVIVCVSVFD